MTRTLPITKARINLGEVVSRVRTTGERVILEKGGIPVAALINIELLENMMDSLEIVNARAETQNDPLVNWKDVRKEHV